MKKMRVGVGAGSSARATPPGRQSHMQRPAIKPRFNKFMAVPLFEIDPGFQTPLHVLDDYNRNFLDEKQQAGVRWLSQLISNGGICDCSRSYLSAVESGFA